jgi:cytidylate kinase
MPNTPPSLIAIDGPAASGKSTLSRRLADRLGYRFLDTGLMYRAFTLAALRSGIEPTDEECAPLADSLDMRLVGEPEARIFLGDEDVTAFLHNEEIERHVSAYSRIPAVREAMRNRQREFASGGHAILAGRDIGEVVLPEARLKFYLEASEETRAARRQGERPEPALNVHEALHSRDQGDAPRTFRAGDAVVIDTTHLTLEQVIERAWEAIQCYSD